MAQKQYIDKLYMIKLWERILTLPSELEYNIVDADDKVYTPAGLASTIGHLEYLFGLINGFDAEAKEHTTLTAVDNTIIDVVESTGTNGEKHYTVKVGTKLAKDIEDIEKAYKEFLEKGDVFFDTVSKGTVSGFGSEGQLNVGENAFHVSIPENPLVGLVGGSDEENGLTITTTATGKPTLSMTVGEIVAGNDNLTTNTKVAAAIKKELTDEGQKVHVSKTFGAGTLLPGKITVNTEAGATATGSADVEINPVLTGTNGTKIATDAYVEEQTKGLNAVYGISGEYDDGATVKLTVDMGNTYSGTLTLDETIDGKPGTGDSVVISIDANDFITDAFLIGAKVITPTSGDNANKKCLDLQVKLADGTINDIIVPLDKFDDPLVETTSVGISESNELSIKLSDYMKFDADGKLTLDDSKFAKATSTTGITDPTNLSTKKYVDTQNTGNTTSVSLSGSTGVVSDDTATVNKFGQSGTISVVEKAGAEAKDYTVSIPSLTTTDTTSTKNVVTSISNTGVISVATNEQAGSSSTATKDLAQVGYVDEKVASVTYTGDNQTVSIPTTGTNKNKVSLVADTDGYLTVGTNGLDVNANKLAKDTTATATDATNLVTLGYVTEKKNAAGITIVSSQNTLAITPDDGSRGKTFKVEMLHEAWDNTTADTDFPYNK